MTSHRLGGYLTIGAALLGFATVGALVPAFAADSTSKTPAPAAAPAHDPTQSPWVELKGTLAPNLNHGKYVFKTQASCVSCHGWPGDGKTGKSPRSKGDAANLRKTQLDTDGMIQIVSCGIPGTPMPYHDSEAYKDKRCYGETMADFKNSTPPSAGRSLSNQDIIDVVAYVQQKIKGAGPITKAECEAFFQPGAVACRGLK